MGANFQAEFTLTFLTYDLFGATNAQNGRLLSCESHIVPVAQSSWSDIGVLAAMLQARHVRPALAKQGELKVASNGLFASTISFFLLAALPISQIRLSNLVSTAVLYAAATGLAYVSATVVTGLTAAAAACCDEDGTDSDERLRRGRALGGFRSKVGRCFSKLHSFAEDQGQLGRAIGPILASSVYWIMGPALCYSAIAVALSVVYIRLRATVAADGRDRSKVSKSQ